MPIPGPVDPASNRSLFQSVRVFWRVLIATLYTRLDLFTTELAEEGFRLLYLVGAVLVGLFSLHCAFFFLMLWILAAFWDTAYRLWVIGGIFLVYAAIAGGCFFYAAKVIRNRPRFLGQTLDELRRDAEGLHSAIKPAEPKP